MKVLVCGTRYLGYDGESAFIEARLDEIRFDVSELIAGCAKGVDDVALYWAFKHDIPHEKFTADWTIGKQAGPIRNQRMIDSGPDLVMAFPASDSIGTWDTIKRAAKAKIPIRIYPL